MTVNHSKEFKDQETGAHINNIEFSWGVVHKSSVTNYKVLCQKCNFSGERKNCFILDLMHTPMSYLHINVISNTLFHI